MAVVEVTVDNFEEEVLKEKNLVLVDFWASWCGPCKSLSPVVEELADQLTQVKVCKVNVDEQSELAQKFRVMSIPTLMVFRDGNVDQTSIGLKSKSGILELLSQ